MQKLIDKIVSFAETYAGKIVIALLFTGAVAVTLLFMFG